jgi:hypothetical protein
VDLSRILLSSICSEEAAGIAESQRYRQFVQKQVKWCSQSMPTSIFIGRREKPASPNAGWFANLADLPGTIRKTSTLKSRSDFRRDPFQRLDNTSAAFHVENNSQGAAESATPC